MPESHSETTAEPFDPYCSRFASDIPQVVAFARVEKMTPADWVRTEEGTYNSRTDHFACDEAAIEHDALCRLIDYARSRDERIRALSDMLQEVRDTHELWSPRWNHGHSPMRLERDEEMERRIDALLTEEADDG